MNRKQRRAERKQGGAATPGGSPAVQAAFAEALRRHQAGALGDAERLYRQILAVEPRHADSLHLLGVIAHQLGRHDVAAELIGQAIAVDARVAAYQSNRGLALREAGRPEEAVACYRRAIALQPDFAEAHYSLGVALKDLGRPDEAVACCRRALALKPDYAEGHNDLGTALKDLGRLDEAVACYRTAITLRPDRAATHYNLGAALQRQGRLDEAVACYHRALDLQPDFAAALGNLGAAWRDLGRPDEAEAVTRRALALDPDRAEWHDNLGTALQDLGRTDEAVACHGRAVELKPDFAGAHTHLGVARQGQGRLDEAMACHRRALALQPDLAEAHNNLGSALQDLGRTDEAAACTRQAIALKPDYADAHWNHAHCLLLGGEFRPGWDEYEWRWRLKTAPYGGRPRFAQPQWSGGAAAGRTILVWAEQGFGDFIQFSRYLPDLVRSGWRVVVEAPPAMRRLAASMPGVTVVAAGEPLPPFDVHCPLLSLPRAFATTLETIPAAGAILRPDADLVEHWRRRLARLDGLKLGIAWRGRQTHKRDRQRSLDPAWFSGILDLPGVSVVSLQPDGRAEELAALGVPVLDAGPELGDFADTAALVAGLDLAISVDSAVCHLAATLGVPTWSLLEFAGEWRWLKDRSDSPWYPSMRLFRQPRAGDWPAVAAAVAAELRRLAGRAG
jgi:tetratricopeptide (TPR) repeat protein